MRLFFGLWPDSQVRSRIRALAEDLPLQGGRLVAENNTHITLAFLGSVDQATCDALVSGAAHIGVAPFSLQLDMTGWWKKPKIAWLAPSSYPQELSRLAAALHGLAGDCGVSMQDRPYRPHLTLARKVMAPPPDTVFEPISWNINEFCLVESKTLESGVEYQVKVSWPLKIMR